jgi:hypothetical protein
VEADDARLWVMTVEYPQFLPPGADDDGHTGDQRVSPLAISRVGGRSTCLSAQVQAAGEQEARAIGLAGIGHWAEQIGLPTQHPVVVSLFAERNP